MFGKKEQDVRLTEKELKKLKSTMSKKELKEFERNQKDYQKQMRQAQEDMEWEAMMMAEVLSDDDWI